MMPTLRSLRPSGSHGRSERIVVCVRVMSATAATPTMMPAPAPGMVAVHCGGHHVRANVDLLEEEVRGNEKDEAAN